MQNFFSLKKVCPVWPEFLVFQNSVFIMTVSPTLLHEKIKFQKFPAHWKLLKTAGFQNVELATLIFEKCDKAKTNAVALFTNASEFFWFALHYYNLQDKPQSKVELFPKIWGYLVLDTKIWGKIFDFQNHQISKFTVHIVHIFPWICQNAH